MQIDIRFRESSTFINWRENLIPYLMSDRESELYRTFLFLWADGADHLRIQEGIDQDILWLVSTAVEGMLVSW